ncbi:hypothetical protein AB3662_44575 [Sorangium cellulosum]
MVEVAVLRGEEDLRGAPAIEVVVALHDLEPVSSCCTSGARR